MAGSITVWSAGAARGSIRAIATGGRGGMPVLARLGEVIYWAGCLAALGFIALLGYIVWTKGPELAEIVVLLGFALASWLFGRAVLYVLAGR